MVEGPDGCALSTLDELVFAASLLMGPDEVVVAADRDRVITWVSDSVTEAFGWTPEEFRVVCPDLIHPDDVPIKVAMGDRVRATPGARETGIARHRSRDGRWVWLEVVAVNLLHTHGVVLTRFRDVTGTKQAEQALADLGRDELTGLVTRRILRQTLEDRLGAGPAVAVLFCDLDGFKAVNDTLGHDAGDDVLRALGARLRRWQTLDGSLVGRWGGDEFVALCELPPDGLDDVVGGFTRAVRGEEGVPELDGSVGVAIGVVGEDAIDVVRRADAAMYTSKRARQRTGELTTPR